jgi:hypothetical protein
MQAVAIAGSLVEPARPSTADFPAGRAWPDRAEAGELLALLLTIARARFATDHEARRDSIAVFARFRELATEFRTALSQEYRHG